MWKGFNFCRIVTKKGNKCKSEKYKGIVTRSNYSEYFTDLSPAFNFKKLEEIKWKEENQPQ